MSSVSPAPAPPLPRRLSASSSPQPRAGPRLTAATRSGFVPVPGSGTAVSCVHCGKQFAAQRSTSTNLTIHMRKCPKLPPASAPAPPLLGKRRSTEDECTEKLSRLIVECGLPLDLVESAAFQEFVDAVMSCGGRWSVPSRRTLTRRLVEDGDRAAAASSAALTKAGPYALSADGWSSSANTGYLAVMAHSIDDAWVRRSMVLTMKPVYVKHTADNLAQAIKDLVGDRRT
jgi:hypothetical protein